MGSAAHPRDGHALAPDMLDRPPQIQRHVPRVHPPTAQTWDLRPWRRIRSSVAAKAARGDQQGEHSGRNKSSPWLRNKSSITRATRGAREWATNWLPGDQDRGRQDKGGIPWGPQVAAAFAENVGVPEAEYPAAAPSARPGSGIGRMARTNLEKFAEIRGFSVSGRIVATDWASSRTSLCELFIRKAGGSWVSRGGPRRRFAMGRCGRLRRPLRPPPPPRRHRGPLPPDADPLEPESPTGDTPKRHQRR